jgi:3-hydroxybutyryl-CoA dehydrogenase
VVLTYCRDFSLRDPTREWVERGGDFAGGCMDVKTVAVIGAGTMGRGIAYAAALGGYRTVLEDVSPEMLVKATAWIRQAFDEGVSRGKVAPETRDRSLAMISTAGKIEDAIRDAELIIEAVPEEMEMKIELFTIFDKFAKPNAILASTTPWLSVAEMAAVTFCRDRCIGMKVVHEGPEMNRVELVVTSDTSKPTIEACWGVAQRLGKEVVLVRETDSGIGSWRKGKGAGG